MKWNWNDSLVVVTGGAGHAVVAESRGSNHSRKPNSTLAWVTGLSLGAGISFQGVAAARASMVGATGAASRDRLPEWQPGRAIASRVRAMKRGEGIY